MHTKFLIFRTVLLFRFLKVGGKDDNVWVCVWCVGLGLLANYVFISLFRSYDFESALKLYYKRCLFPFKPMYDWFSYSSEYDHMSKREWSFTIQGSFPPFFLLFLSLRFSFFLPLFVSLSVALFLFSFSPFLFLALVLTSPPSPPPPSPQPRRHLHPIPILLIHERMANSHH